MNKSKIVHEIKKKESFLCIGLDPVLERIPKHLLATEDPIFEFNKMIIDATVDLCVAYKPNTAFYESQGVKGWNSLQKTIDYIPDDVFVIADAKRGDIGNTSKQYAEAFFEKMNCDAITVAPYMGIDSVSPFLEYDGKWVILLALTSNKGSQDFQMLETKGSKVYENVLKISSQWGSVENMMYVVGATHPESFEDIRRIVPDHFLLVPGIGAQGGNLQKVCKYGFNQDCGLLINSSRGIIYATGEGDEKDLIRNAAHSLQKEMKVILKTHKII